MDISQFPPLSGGSHRVTEAAKNTVTKMAIFSAKSTFAGVRMQRGFPEGGGSRHPNARTRQRGALGMSW